MEEKIKKLEATAAELIAKAEEVRKEIENLKAKATLEQKTTLKQVLGAKVRGRLDQYFLSSKGIIKKTSCPTKDINAFESIETAQRVQNFMLLCTLAEHYNKKYKSGGRTYGVYVSGNTVKEYSSITSQEHPIDFVFTSEKAMYHCIEDHEELLLKILKNQPYAE